MEVCTLVGERHPTKIIRLKMNKIATSDLRKQNRLKGQRGLREAGRGAAASGRAVTGGCFEEVTFELRL